MLKLKWRKISKLRKLIYCTLVLIVVLSSVSLARMYALKVAGSAYQESGITGTTVYVNDLDADWNYYMGLNFTEIDDSTLPDGSNRELYSASNLAPVILTYSGVDFNDENLVGTVSPLEGETQYEYKYYKYYPIVDGKIKIELIDNPFSSRPMGYGFNGWATDYEGAVLSYDYETYTRYVTIPATSGSTIDLTMHAVWIAANIQIGGASKVANFDNRGMKQIPEVPVYGKVSGGEEKYVFDETKTYYEEKKVDQNETFTGYYLDFNDIGESAYLYGEDNTCTNRRGCTVYVKTADTEIQEDKIYYTFEDDGNGGFVDQENDFKLVTEGEEHWDIVGTKPSFEDGYKAVSIFYKQDISGDRSLYYNQLGVSCDHANANCTNGNTYKLLQNSDPEITISVDSDAQSFYYLVTRDMNILRYTGTGESLDELTSLSKPYTLTGYTFDAQGNNSLTTRYVTGGTVNIEEDFGIENIFVSYNLAAQGAENANPTGTINANYYNLKIGRNVRSRNEANFTLRGVYGSDTGNYEYQRFRIIVESGVYNHLVAGGQANTEYHIHSTCIYGSDYDRVNGEEGNKKLRVLFSAMASYYGGLNSNNEVNPATTTIIKSGSYGKKLDGSYNMEDTRFTWGVNAGGRANATSIGAKALSILKVEGGDINVINGGSNIAEAFNRKNSIAIYMTGGTALDIFGGAGVLKTYGNRIISVTGGHILYNIFGGSNSFQGTDVDGTLDGSVLLYVGGDVIVGGQSDDSGETMTLYNAHSGDVFGAGSGRSGEEYINLGTVNSAHVIIDGNAQISGDVYGGGNYGSTGKLAELETTTAIDLLGGTINGNVYGSSNNNGSGKRGIKDYNNIAGIDYYQGMDSVSVGEVIPTSYTFSVWDGTQGRQVTYTYQTYLYDNSEVLPNTICTEDNVSYDGTGCVYAYQKVPKGTDSNTYTNDQCKDNYCPFLIPSLYTVGFEDGRWHLPNDVDTMYGDEAHTITINQVGSKVGKSIYGGANTAGTVFAHVIVNLKGGSVGSEVYGGGKGQNTYVSGNVEVNVDGFEGDITVYGGSEEGIVGFTPEDESVSTKNVTVNLKKGRVNTLYAGSKGSATVSPLVASRTSVNVTGGEAINVYGGNNINGSYGYATHVYLKGGTVTNAYGASNNTGMDKYTYVYLDGATVTNIFGGSNISGETVNNNVIALSGTATNIYGGNNQGGNTVLGSVLLKGGAVTNAYGCGKGSATNCTNSVLKVDGIDGLNLTKAYGGGESASVLEKTQVVLLSGSVNSLYGGSNVMGTIPESYVYVSDGQAVNVYGGNNQGGTTTTTNVYVGGGEVTNAYGGGDVAATETTNLKLYDGTVTSAFGGGHKAGVMVANVDAYGGTIANIYGGSNNEGVVVEANVNVMKGEDMEGSLPEVDPDTDPDEEDKPTEPEVDNWESTYKYKDAKITYEMDTPNYNRTCQSGMDETKYACGYTYMAKVYFYYDNPYNEPIENYNIIFLGSDSDFLIPTEGQYYPKIEIFKYTSNTFKSTGYYYANQSWCDPTRNCQIYLEANREHESLGSFIIYYNDKNFVLTTDFEENINPKLIQNTSGGGGDTGDIDESITFTSPAYKVGSMNFTDVYGGNNQGGKTVTANVKVLEDAMATNVYGGGNEAVTDYPHVLINKGTVTNVYGGGNGTLATVSFDTDVVIDDGIVLKNAYGGGNSANTVNSTNINLISGEIGESIFGGGNSSSTGLVEGDHAVSTVNIISGTIGKNVYGGANTSVIYGTANVFIGKKAESNIDASKYEYPKKIDIKGTVFGGGESNAENNEDYTFDFFSVTEAIVVDINALDYDINIDQSIFGSGNASSSKGDSDVTISNWGELDKVETITSIQRANNVYIINSNLQLLGARDSTNRYGNLFTFNRINHLYMLNNTSLYLRTGANVLKNFYSGLYSETDSFVKESVMIDDSGNVIQNVKNRLYMAPNKVLNVLTEEDVNEDYAGDVHGMAFLGMFVPEDEYKMGKGFYDSDLKTGDVVSDDEAELLKHSGTYVYGRHYENHDITVDGFYSNYLGEDSNEITVDYVGTIPENAKYYMWTIGVQVSSFEIDLYASRYSTLGVKQLSLTGFQDPDTKYIVNAFQYGFLEDGIQLVDKSKVKKIADSSEIANTTFGLSVGTSDTGWKSSEMTDFYSSKPSITGSTEYETVSDTVTSTLSFYFYHSKNVELEEDEDLRDLGYTNVILTAVAPDPDDPLSSKVSTIEIKVNLHIQKYVEDGYSSIISPGKKYQVFPYIAANITNKSSVSIYHNLFMDLNGVDSNGENWSYDKLYPEGSYRALTSEYVYPVGTTITMLDLMENEYYYYTVDEAKYAEKMAEFAAQNEVSYRLDEFIKMDSVSPDNTYNDAEQSKKYYDAATNSAMEEFIFTVDFANTNITEDVSSKLYLELRDSKHNDAVLMKPLPSEGDRMRFNIFVSGDTDIETTGSLASDVLYVGESELIDLATTYKQAQRDGVVIYDTTYDDYKLGSSITIYDSQGNKLDGTSLLGVAFNIDGKYYYPQTDGTIRINLAGRIANINSSIIMETASSNLTSGDYTIKIETFGSFDGLYNSNVASTPLELKVKILNNLYGLVVDSTDIAVTHDKDDGTDDEGNNKIDFDITTSSGLENPNLRVSLERRTYDGEYDLTYEKVNLLDYVTDTLDVANADNFEYYVTKDLPEKIEFSLTLKDSTLKTGTYRIMFSVYDGENYIGSVYRYLIIRDM